MNSAFKEFSGEAAGTFILVFLGCGAVAVSILFNWLPNIIAIAAVWGCGVVIAIYAVRSVCSAHFNPAVSLAMSITGNFQKNKLAMYFGAQLAGSVMAGIVLHMVLGNAIQKYEAMRHITRGTYESVVTARMFGEFYAPHPVLSAMAAEAAGTFLLTAIILTVSRKQSDKDGGSKLAALYIGAGLAVLICLFASVTQAGFNPARDFGPRLVSFFTGWGKAAFPDNAGGFFWVYIFAPFCGSALAALLYNFLLKYSSK
ncbi:hypothetical protein A8C56_13035 [Niabella ginsenosidivorans]|uniref:Aquaporin n=1 Tax=Niabella ginsenosidivorans TaxID=1176587 RepID=A0A1A9I5E9_9BACT|nr:MIP/aquaporin family protein [Niabella ginsenosidivorans]ANH81784.1 hypothetical protein A8C56_13035 [Niabella ginsenosidivorans]